MRLFLLVLFFISTFQDIDEGDDEGEIDPKQLLLDKLADDIKLKQEEAIDGVHDFFSGELRNVLRSIQQAQFMIDYATKDKLRPKDEQDIKMKTTGSFKHDFEFYKQLDFLFQNLQGDILNNFQIIISEQNRQLRDFAQLIHNDYLQFSQEVDKKLYKVQASKKLFHKFIQDEDLLMKNYKRFMKFYENKFKANENYNTLQRIQKLLDGKKTNNKGFQDKDIKALKSIGIDLESDTDEFYIYD